MLLSNSDNDKLLFAKSVPVSVRDVYTNQSRKSNLFLSMEWQEASSGMYNRKVLVISLTDNDDPFFLYNLHISEEDFQSLKASQDLLINFNSFPQHIIDYIETCLLEERNAQPKFLLVFSINDKLGNVASPSQLDIVETNQFKHLTHLSLKFVAATESAVRQYLASCFRKLKEQNATLQSKLSFLEHDSREKLAAWQLNLSGKEQELELFKKKLNAELSMKDSKHAMELAEERDRLISRQREEETRLEREKREKEQDLCKKIQQLEVRITCLDTLNKELKNKNDELEAKLRDSRSSIRHMEDKIKRLNENIEILKQTCNDIQSECDEKQSLINTLNGELNNSEKEVKNKARIISKKEQEIEEADRKLNSLQADLEHANLLLEMSEKTQKMLNDEKSDMNRRILKIQDKAKQFKKESELAAKYKESNEEKEKQILELKKETAEAHIILMSKDAEIKSLKNSIDSLEKKIHTLEKELKDKDNVISFLHKQATDKLIIPQYSPEIHLEPSSSSVAQRKLGNIHLGAPRKSPGFDSSPTGAGANTASQKSVRRILKEPCPATGNYARKSLRC